MTQKALWIILLFAILQGHCVQSYVSPYKSPATGYLVVEGYITGNGPTYFKLSRTIPLPGDSTSPVVTGAQLQIEGTDNSIYPFTEAGNGFYLLPAIAMNSATQYRLRVSNVNNETYLSDYVPYKATPPIDSVNWTSNPLGVNIYANTHDPTGNTRYYQWKYNETWEYHSAEQSDIIFLHDSLLLRTAAEQIYYCYHSDSSSSIFVGTSDKLMQDVIYLQPLIFIPVNTQPLAIEYSALVSQYALTDTAYNYLTLLKSNTEQLGSIFDPLPSQLTGNIHCLTNPNELVIGFISAGTLQQQRIYINYLQVPQWHYYVDCSIPDTIVYDGEASMIHFFDQDGFIPIYHDMARHFITANLPVCVDCRYQGGSTTKPSFMP